MPKIETIRLRCIDPHARSQFYCDVLGMNDYGDGVVGYGGEQAKLHFIKSNGNYIPQPNHTYWKIALGVPDIDLAYQQLLARGIQVTVPGQFQDVGLLAKFTDPEGFIIELIDHWFQGERPQQQVDQTLFGGGAHFNLLTLRAAGIDSVREFCDSCAMKLLSVQPIDSQGFTLYFWAFTDDVMPAADPLAVANRTWVYQRQYTVLEVQHVHNAPAMTLTARDALGYAGTICSGLSAELHSSELLIGSESVIQTLAG